MSVTPHGSGYPGGYGLPEYENTGGYLAIAMPAKVETAKVASEEPEKKKRKALKDLINEFAEESTAHGIPRVISSVHWWAKLFWLILVCGLAGVFLYQGYGLIFDFIHWPYSTKVDVITKRDANFPAVTVCNMNRMKRSKLVGTRYQGMVDIDGGFDLDSDYSWFWDFSSDFYTDWYSVWDWNSDLYGGNSSSNSSSNISGSSSSDISGSSSSSSDISGSSSSSDISGSSSSSDISGGRSSSSVDDGSSVGGGGLDPTKSENSAGEPSWWDEDIWGDDFSFIEWDEWESFNFEYDDYYDWDVTGESDWDGFYAQSKTDDFSDIIDVANPTREELQDYGHQAKDLILQCTFDKRSCNYSDFKQFQNNHYGNCYTFNHVLDSNTARKTHRVGAQYGLHLTLFVEQPEYVGLLTPESGVRVSVNWPTVQPYPEDSGITATTGQATSIGMRQNKIIRLGHPYSKCTDGSNTDYTHPVYEYSVAACEKQCFQHNLHDRCGCITDILVDGDKCSYLNSTQQRCKQLVETLYNDEKLDCFCPDPCDEVIYTTTTSSALWPSERYEQHLYSRVAETNDLAARTLQDMETTRKNLVRLKIYFEELNFQQIEQQKTWTIEGISGSVGGLMGLYLGISAVSLMEIIIFLLKILLYIFSCGHFPNRVHPE